MTVDVCPEYIRKFFEKLGYDRIRIIELRDCGYALEYFNDWDYSWGRFFRTEGEKSVISFYFNSKDFDKIIREHLKETRCNLLDKDRRVVQYPADEIEWEFWKRI